MKKLLFFVCFFVTLFAFGQSAASSAPSLASISSASSSAASVGAPSADLPVGDFLSQIMNFIQSFGGLSLVLKISGAVLLIIASFKVSILNKYVWSKLGSFQAYAAPVLGLLVGVLGLGTGGAPITLGAVLTYLAAGAGAIPLHELLDTLKAIPGLGSVYVSIITAIESVLGGPSSAVGAVPGK